MSEVTIALNSAAWNTLRNSLYPSASDASIRMVVDYCVARKLDPLKKPCHIVPLRVKDAQGQWGWRDVVMPGIYELRTTAMRTGLYVGQDEPLYGPVVPFMGVMAPEWVKIVVHRYSELAKEARPFTGMARYSECVGLTKDGAVNDRWSKAPYQMLEKCAEAAALRKAFPDEIGGEYAAEEMEGQQPAEREIAPNPKAQSKPPQRQTTLDPDRAGKATEKQLDLIRMKCERANIDPGTFLDQFALEALSDLKFELVNDALAWISSEAKP
jgi:phage recombination protein Bet